MNYKKFYQQVLKTILSGKSDQVLRQYPNYYVNNKDLISFNNHSIFLIPKNKNILAPDIGERLSETMVETLVPKDDADLTALLPTDTIIGVKPQGRVLKKPDGTEYRYRMDNSYFGYFDKDIKVMVNLNKETSLFYLFEDEELVCILAPMRVKD